MKTEAIVARSHAARIGLRLDDTREIERINERPLPLAWRLCTSQRCKPWARPRRPPASEPAERFAGLRLFSRPAAEGLHRTAPSYARRLFRWACGPSGCEA